MEDQGIIRWLLVSDVDGTLTGSDEGILALAGIGIQIALVLNSSRPRESVIRTLDLLPPALRIEGLISAMGTEIWLRGVDQVEWVEQFADWDRGPVDEFMTKAGAIPHRAEMQTRYKASFAVPAERWEYLRGKILALSPESRVITSGESDFDVIPAAAGKDKSTSWVARKLGFDPGRVIVAGDSGNDLAMFRAARMAIAVGNARRELVEKADPDRTYFAEKESACGLIEGLRHWGAIR
jgi:hydroxymethylpyrimidine pyrophosphatase-like HAD family hydrolase